MGGCLTKARERVPCRRSWYAWFPTHATAVIPATGQGADGSLPDQTESEKKPSPSAQDPPSSNHREATDDVTSREGCHASRQSVSSVPRGQGEDECASIPLPVLRALHDLQTDVLCRHIQEPLRSREHPPPSTPCPEIDAAQPERRDDEGKETLLELLPIHRRAVARRGGEGEAQDVHVNGRQGRGGQTVHITRAFGLAFGLVFGLAFGLGLGSAFRAALGLDGPAPPR